ncbi:prephenate dehydratase [Paenibacillus thalictri]|uniref:Prephenate dehydratase n=1 Tax=Paenibacillus thalictri TaxID=2527873 RepID=A0A4Q9E0F3_9BACL|nr:prephenate dehydratase [Paenibacillus thalictri]TBL81613.1 prephenate dehydratase [Paenibacillus thalictri]
MKRIAILGPGTFTEESAHYFLGNAEHEYVSLKTIEDVFLSTVSGKTDLSVIPIENTFEGSVRLHIDWLVNEMELLIQAEWDYPISVNLLGKRIPGESAEEMYARIRKIYSHHVTPAQCREFVKEHLPHAEFELVGSNGEAARLVKELGTSDIAAIGPLAAGGMYGLDTLAGNIHDHQNNFTRFVIVGAEPPELKPNDYWKTTVVVTLPEDFPGALHQVLSAFSWRRINLSKIESRPTKKKLGTYYFYIDIEASMDSVLLPAAIEEIRALGCLVRILGCYPSYSYEQA